LSSKKKKECLTAFCNSAKLAQNAISADSKEIDQAHQSINRPGIAKASPWRWPPQTLETAQSQNINSPRYINTLGGSGFANTKGWGRGCDFPQETACSGTRHLARFSWEISYQHYQHLFVQRKLPSKPIKASINENTTINQVRSPFAAGCDRVWASRLTRAGVMALGLKSTERVLATGNVRLPAREHKNKKKNFLLCRVYGLSANVKRHPCRSSLQLAVGFCRLQPGEAPARAPHRIIAARPRVALQSKVVATSGISLGHRPVSSPSSQSRMHRVPPARYHSDRFALYRAPF